MLLLLAIWVLNFFDLESTLIESQRYMFVELNPFASLLIRLPVHALVLYKVALVALGSGLLIACRRHRAAELACWFLLLTYLLVICRWSAYYSHLLDTFNDPATNICPIAGVIGP